MSFEILQVHDLNIQVKKVEIFEINVVYAFDKKKYYLIKLIIICYKNKV